MDVVFHLQGVEFEWDVDKAESNLRKHGVTFEEAAEVFFDPFRQVGDASVNDDEDRDFVVGYNYVQRLLLVVNTDRGLRTRIISARPATQLERSLYDSA